MASLTSVVVRFMAFFLLLISLVLPRASALPTTLVRARQNIGEPTSTSSFQIFASNPAPVQSGEAPFPILIRVSDSRNSTAANVTNPDDFTTEMFCDIEYFDTKHWIESNAGPWYAKWVAEAISNNSETWQNRKSEPVYFVEQILSWPDMDCGVTLMGCTQRPTCEAILEKTAGNKNLARKIFFVIESFHNMNLISGVIAQQSTNAQATITDEVPAIAHTFVWQFDPAQQNNCDMVKGLVLFGISAATAMVGAAIPVIGPIGMIGAAGGVAGVEAAEGTAAAETSEFTRGFQAWLGTQKTKGSVKLTNLETSVANLGEQTASRAALGSPSNYLLPIKTRPQWAWTKEVQYHMANGWNEFVQPPLWQQGWASLMGAPAQFDGPAIAKGICAMFPNGDKDAPDRYIQQISVTIGNYSAEYRRAIDTSMAAVNNGTGYGDDGTFEKDSTSRLADQIILGNYVALSHSQHERFVNNPSVIEHQMTWAFRNAIISSLLKSQFCHVHCATTEHHNQPFLKSKARRSEDDPVDCEWATGNGDRFCPDEKTRCQAQCWRNSKKGVTMELFGMNELRNSGSQIGPTVNELLMGSYRNWQRLRFKPNAMLPSVEDLLFDTLNDGSGASLPVCYDPFGSPERIGSQKIPCTCGSTWSNETALFVKAAQFDKWALKQPHQKSALGQLCMHITQQNHVPPAEQFIAMCRLNTHWPVGKEREMTPGQDVRCDELTTLANALGVRPSEEINCKFCDIGDTDGTNSLADSQNRWMDGTSYRASFEARCRLFHDGYDCDQMQPTA